MKQPSKRIDVMIHAQLVFLLSMSMPGLTVGQEVVRFENIEWAQRRLEPPKEELPLPETEPIYFPTLKELETEALPHDLRTVWPEDSTTHGQDRPHKVWWSHFLTQSILARSTVPISANDVALQALQYAPQISVLAAGPQRGRAIAAEEISQFDWSVFLRSNWRDTTEPTGSSLTTGGPNIYRDHNFTHATGVRKRTGLGGDLSVSQLFGLQRTNSSFFVPSDQGSAIFTIDYSQPLLRGAGQSVNQAPIILAQLASDSADMDFVSQVQDYLSEVHQTYWELYALRASLLIERRLFQRAADVLAQLKKRENVDVTKELILRAESSLATRRTRLVVARQRVLDQQAILRNVVNSPQFSDPMHQEFVPVDVPISAETCETLEDAFQTAMCHRSEIAKAIREVRAGGIRHRLAENELLPELNLVLQTYAKGLQGNNDLGQAYEDQFSISEPSYSAGLMFELPLGRRAEKARLRRRSVEMNELVDQFRVQVEQVLLEVILEHRQFATTFQTLQTNREAMDNGIAELKYLTTRYELMTGQDRSASLHLQDILMTHVRLADIETAFVRSQVNHVVSLVRLRRAMGTLVRPTV